MPGYILGIMSPALHQFRFTLQTTLKQDRFEKPFRGIKEYPLYVHSSTVNDKTRAGTEELSQPEDKIERTEYVWNEQVEKNHLQTIAETCVKFIGEYRDLGITYLNLRK